MTISTSPGSTSPARRHRPPIPIVAAPPVAAFSGFNSLYLPLLAAIDHPTYGSAAPDHPGRGCRDVVVDPPQPRLRRRRVWRSPARPRCDGART